MTDTNSLSRVEISKRLVLINSASSLVALGLNVTVLIWLQQFLLKRISTEEYSILPVLYSLMMFAPLLTTTLTQGLGRYTTEAYARGDTTQVARVVSSMVPILVGVTVILLFVGLIFTHYLDRILTIAPVYESEAKLMLALLLFALAGQVVLAPFSVGLEVRQRFVALNVLGTAGQFLRFGILCLLLFTVSVKVLWVVVATVTAGFITQLAILALSLKAVPSLRFRWSLADRSVARQLLSFGGWSTVSALAITIRTSADAIILNKLATPTDVAVFHLAALPLRFITLAASAVQRPLRPVLVAMHATAQHDRLRRIFLKGGRWALWCSLFLCVPFMVYGREIMTLYVGKEFHAAGIVMLLLLMLFPFREGVNLLFGLAEATANVRKLSIYLLSISLFNLALTLYLVGVLDMGALGSGLGTAVSIVLLYPLLLWPLGLKFGRVGFKMWCRKTMAPGLCPSAAAAIVLLALKAVVSVNSWPSLLGSIAVGCLIYVATLWFGCLQEEDRHDMRKAYSAVLALPGAGVVVKSFAK